MADVVVVSAASAGFASLASACLQASEKKRKSRPCLEESTLDSQDCKDCWLRELTFESLCRALRRRHYSLQFRLHAPMIGDFHARSLFLRVSVDRTGSSDFLSPLGSI